MFTNFAISSTTRRVPHPAGLMLAAAVCVLAFEPARWLLSTWYAPGYDGLGIIAFAVVAALFVWSLSSGRTHTHTGLDRPGLMYGLLGCSAALRLTAQLLDINLIGALLLCVDVYALARLLQLHRRARPVSPLWLAATFCFALPVEPILQRIFGYGLQQISAAIACGGLMPWYDELACPGTRLVIGQTDVLVDLPCSGSKLLSQLGFITAIMHAVRRPGIACSLLGIAVSVVLGLLINSLRIMVLAMGIHHADALPVDVMAPQPHSLIGLVCVALATAAMYRLASSYPPAQDSPKPHAEPRHAAAPPSPAVLPACGFLLFALTVGAVQPRPVDASLPFPPPQAPLVAADFSAQTVPLSAQEQHYFQRYGGTATRVAYGPFGLLLVRTSSPLRHLHDPVVCLRGLGFNVRLLGTDHANATTIYQARAAQDDTATYEIHVSFLSSSGKLASSVSEVVWHWIFHDRESWTMVQRIAPTAITPQDRNHWHQAMRRAFNIQVQEPHHDRA